MDAKHAQLEKKFEELLKQTAEVSAQLQALDQGASVPHFDQIELPAHAVGQRLSRLIQTTRAREVAATTPPQSCLSGLRPGMPGGLAPSGSLFDGWSCRAD